MFGLGKPNKTKFGRFLASKGISATWVAEKSKVSRITINKLVNKTPDYHPNTATIKKIMRVINAEIDPNKKSSDFFDI